ncbi:MAG: extracellular solute-binding protein [Planctomycetota bacterium]
MSDSLGTISRRTAVGAMALAGAGYAFLGPRGRRRDADGRIVIDYWEKWTGHEGAAMLDLVTRFNAEQDEIHVRYLTTSGIDRKAMVAIAGGHPPDVLGLWSYSLPGFAGSGALEPLDLDSLGAPRAHYAAPVWPLMCDRGTRYAAVSTCGTTALYIDRAAARTAGLDADRPPETIDAFDEWVVRLSTTAPDGGLARVGFMHVEPGWWSWAWGGYFGGRLYDPATDRLTIATPENLEAYTWLQSYPDRFGVDDLLRMQSTFGNYGSMHQAFLAGTVAMIKQGPWLASIINAFRPDMDYMAVPFPVERSLLDPSAPVGVLEADVLVVPVGARQPEAARTFIAWTQQQENLERLATAHAKGTPLATMSATFVSDHPNRSIAVHDAVLRSPRVLTVPPVRAWPVLRDELNAAVERLWTMTATPNEALRAVQTRAADAHALATERTQRRAARARGAS